MKKKKKKKWPACLEVSFLYKEMFQVALITYLLISKKILVYDKLFSVMNRCALEQLLSWYFVLEKFLSEKKKNKKWLAWLEVSFLHKEMFQVALITSLLISKKILVYDKLFSVMNRCALEQLLSWYFVLEKFLSEKMKKKKMTRLSWSQLPP